MIVKVSTQIKHFDGKVFKKVKHVDAKVSTKDKHFDDKVNILMVKYKYPQKLKFSKVK